jgi:predicted mannosyl-3-phosphoglycerate phosphatase (HAD superfamily)
MVDVSHKTASVRVAHAQVGDQYNDTASFEKVDYAYSFPSIGNG